MFSLVIEYLPDNDQEEIGTYASSMEAINAFVNEFDKMERFKGATPMLILKFNGREVHKESKPVHRKLDVLSLFRVISGVL